MLPTVSRLRVHDTLHTHLQLIVRICSQLLVTPQSGLAGNAPAAAAGKKPQRRGSRSVAPPAVVLPEVVDSPFELPSIAMKRMPAPDANGGEDKQRVILLATKPLTLSPCISPNSLSYLLCCSAAVTVANCQQGY